MRVDTDRLSPNASSKVRRQEWTFSDNNNGNAVEGVVCDFDRNDDDLESERSSLIGTVLLPKMTHHQSMTSLSSASVRSTPMDYSTDDNSSVTAFSTSNQGSRRSKRNTGAPYIHYYNPQTIHTGSFVLSVLGSSSSSQATSDIESCATIDSDDLEDDLLASDHYFADPLDLLLSPKEQLRVSSPNETLGDSKCFIFTDDEDDCCTTSMVRHDNLENNSNHNPDRVNVLSSTTASPHSWEQYNQSRGRIVAQQMLQSYREKGSEGRVSDRLSDAGETGFEDSEHLRPSLVWRVLEPYKRLSRPMKRFTQSTSALDQSFKTSGNNSAAVRHRISELACQAIADAERGSLSSSTHSVNNIVYGNPNMSSAVQTRNTMVNFTAWEAVLRDNGVQLSSTMSISADGIESELALDETSHSSADDDLTDDDTALVRVKPVSIFGRKPSMTHSPYNVSTSSDEKSLDTDNQLCHYNEGLSRRITSEDVASELGIAVEGLHLVRHIRGRAGIIDDLYDDKSTSLVHCSSLPWINLYEDIWVPHYEEYVVRAVHAFSCLLLRSSNGSQPHIQSV